MPALFHSAKSGVLAAFFMQATLALAAPAPLPDNATLATLAANPVWQALLHSEHGRANIADPDFSLSLPQFSPQAELKATLDRLQSDPAAVCRFPARYWWLQRQLALPALPLDDCPDVATFRQKAPLQTLSLVFVSENLTQPSSIMGHAFLKLSGTDNQGRQQDHAISFYTDADTVNLPKLLFESLATGKQGYFALGPYQEQQSRYTDDEERNVWEYDLALDDWQRELVRLHLLELKQTRLRYYFQDYNCATLVRFIMALSGKMPPRSPGWVSPKDLVRSAREAGLIATQRTITPSRWMARTLGQQLPPAQLAANIAALASGEITAQHYPAGDTQAFVALMHADALNQYQYLQGKLDATRWRSNTRALTQLREQHFAGLNLDGDPRLDPSTAPQDSQLAAQWQRRDGQPALTLSLLPASHQLADDNRSYQRENGLQLLQPTLLLPLDGSQPRLDSFRLYGVQSLLPYDTTTGGLAGKLDIAYAPQYGRQLQLARATTLGGMLGLATRPHADIDAYALVGGALAWRAGNASLQADAEAGLILRGMYNSKLLLAHSWHYNQLDSGSTYRQLDASLQWYPRRQHTLSIGGSWLRQHGARVRQQQLGYRYLF